jgi:hypothetical protein
MRVFADRKTDRRAKHTIGFGALPFFYIYSLLSLLVCLQVVLHCRMDSNVNDCNSIEFITDNRDRTKYFIFVNLMLTVRQ